MIDNLDVADDGHENRSDHGFRVLFTTHPTPMWVYDPDTLQFLIINDAAIALYGFTRQQLVTMTVVDIRPQSERNRMLTAIKNKSDLERPERWEHLKANGEIIDVLTYGRLVHFNGIDAILVVVQDRTELAEANRQVHHTQSLLDSLVKNLPLGVFVKDMGDAGRYVLYNEAAAIIAGQPLEKVIGATDADLMSVHDAKRFFKEDLLAMGRTDVLTLDRNVLLSGGEKRIVRVIKRHIPPVGDDAPRYLIGLLEDITEQRQVEARMAHIALHDMLTDLPNRTYFTQYVADLLENEPLNTGFALLYLDIDHFKHVNDSLGHEAGDALLKAAALRLMALMSPSDFVARLGGDEFAIVYRNDNIGRISMFADQLMEVFQQPFHLDGNEEYVSCSIGIAHAPLHGQDVNTLLRSADLALYASKSDGRNTFSFYENRMRLVAEKRHILTAELRQALLEEQFELYYQPIFTLHNERISGFEALIRWHHPQRGMILPAEFIAVAEETGLISAIGDWVLRQACKTAATWPDAIKVSVNLSAVQFNQSALLESVVHALTNAQLAPDRLELEITESVFLTNNKQNVHLLFEMRKLGVRIAMDDFGTGYSSLSYLRAFPFDKIKVDRSFVSGIGIDPRDLAIIQAVATLGNGFNIITTAEGVETAQQLSRLKDERFGEVQGFFTGRPMSADKVQAFIVNQHGTGMAPARPLMENPAILEHFAVT